MKIKLLPFAFLACVVSSAWAQSPPSANIHPFVSGLNFPRGLKFGPDGNLYVAEAGAGGNTSTAGVCTQVSPPEGPFKGGSTSRISKITPAGARTTLVDSLPSAVDAMGSDIGIADLAFIGDTLYALSGGAGCAHGHANEDNAILRVNPDNTTTAIADLSAFVKANPVTSPFPGDFDPEGSWYNMTSARGALVVVEANHGELDMITPAGVVTRIADLSLGHPVPTALAYDGDFYVGNLGGFPIVDGSEKILKITPTGQVTTFATGFSTIVGLAFDPIHRLYVLENTTGGNQFPTPGTGRVSRIDAAGKVEVIATGLALPTGMTFGPNGDLYVSNWGFGPPNMGEIVRISTQGFASGLSNISTRGLVQTGDNVLISGFIVKDNSQKVLIRGMGPSLTQFGVSGALGDPFLDLRDGNGNRLTTNDNWKDTQASAIQATGYAPSNESESAILTTLPAGLYTAILRGVNNGTGIGLVEVYALP